MQLRQGGAHGRALAGARMLHAHFPQALHKSGRAALQHMQDLPRGVGQRARARHASPGEESHQRHEVAELGGTLVLEQGEHIPAAVGIDAIVGVLDPRGNPGEVPQPPSPRRGNEGSEHRAPDAGVDGHGVVSEAGPARAWGVALPTSDTAPNGEARDSAKIP